MNQNLKDGLRTGYIQILTPANLTLPDEDEAGAAADGAFEVAAVVALVTRVVVGPGLLLALAVVAAAAPGVHWA